MSGHTGNPRAVERREISVSVVVKFRMIRLAAEDAIPKRCIGKDDWHDDYRTDQREGLARMRCCCLPDRDARKDRVRPDGGKQPDIAQQDESKRKQKRCDAVARVDSRW